MPDCACARGGLTDVSRYATCSTCRIKTDAKHSQFKLLKGTETSRFTWLKLTEESYKAVISKAARGRTQGT